MSDFTSEADIGVVFSSVELDTGVDFEATGDFGLFVIDVQAFGEGGFGEGPFGGRQVVQLDSSTTTWTNITTP